MKLVSTILLASGLGMAMAADSANLRVGDESRQLADADYSSSSSSSSSTSLSGGTWMWYLMLNGLALGVDVTGHGCNGGCQMPSCGKDHRKLNWWGGDDWTGDEWTDDAWEGDSYEGGGGGGGGDGSSDGGGNGGGGNEEHHCPARCCAPHVPAVHIPHKTSAKNTHHSSSSSSTNTDDKVIHWGDDGHWANDGHSVWSDDGNYWYDDGAWYDDNWGGDGGADGGWDDDGHWANDGYYYWDDDAHNSEAHWLSNNNSEKQSWKSKIFYPLLVVGLVVVALAVALVTRRVS